MNIFIKPLLRQSVIASLLSLLAACASTDQQDDDDFVQFDSKPSIATPVPLGEPAVLEVAEAEPVVEEQAKKVETPAEPQATDITDKPLPNPYLSQAKSVNSTSQKQFKQALAAFKAKQYAKARRLFVALSQAQPQLSGPYLNLALLAVKQKQPQQAQQYFQQAIKANGQNIYAYSEYAYWLRQQGKFDEAKLQLQQALEVWPDYPTAHRNLGILLDLYQGQGEQALLHYKKYQSLLAKPDRLVRAWIVDLERRLKAQAKAAAASASEGEAG